MLKLGRTHVVLDAEAASGWNASGDGIIFHFKESASVRITKEMADRIATTFKHEFGEPKSQG